MPLESPTVAILILNYHQPEATLACVRRLLEREGAGTRILWIENDATRSQEALIPFLEASGLPWTLLEADGTTLPPAQTVGVILVPENLGYAGGNNVGARLAHRCGVSYLWIMNNDTLLESGSSRDLIAAAEARPEVGVWGTTIRSREGSVYCGGKVQLKDFAITFICSAKLLQEDQDTFVSGCSLFVSTDLAAQIGFLPEDYFLYYEDPAFTFELRRRNHSASMVPEVEVFHEESLTTGRRSPFMEFYNRRNRWAFIQRYYPEHLNRQRWRFFYRVQSLAFRGALDRLRVECLALWDWQRGRMGPTHRQFTQKARRKRIQAT